MQSLRLRFNNIGDISALTNLTNLWLLDLSGNDISDVGALENLSGLLLLYLDNNNLTKQKVEELCLKLPQAQIQSEWVDNDD